MDNEEDYIELHRLLAKYQFNMMKEQSKLKPTSLTYAEGMSYYEEK